MIFVLLGEASCGKTFFKKELINANIGLTDVITYTSRPMRENEKDGIDYHFVSKEKMEQMIKNNNLLEWDFYDTIYDEWYYGTHINSFQNNEIDHICVLDYKGYLRTKEMYGDKVIGIMFHREYEERLESYKARGGSLEEFRRRYKADREKFSTADSDADLYHVINNTKRTEDTLKMLKCLIKGERVNAIRNNRL